MKILKVKYSEVAVKNLKILDAVERQLVIKKIHYLAENFDKLKKSGKITELKGTKYKGQYRFIIAKK